MIIWNTTTLEIKVILPYRFVGFYREEFRPSSCPQILRIKHLKLVIEREETGIQDFYFASNFFDRVDKTKIFDIEVIWEEKELNIHSELYHIAIIYH